MTSGTRRGVRIGRLWIDAVTFEEAIQEIERLVAAQCGGAVYTPNVDHVVKADTNEAFQRAYDAASLSLADGMPVVWAARLLGYPLPARVAGSDLLAPLMKRAAVHRWRVYLLGGAPEVAETAARILVTQFGVQVVGFDAPVIGSDGSDISGGTLTRARAARPDLILVALGAPKQEIWIHCAAQMLCPAVAIAVGGALDFLTGRFKRAPRWAARAGLEWMFRLWQEPRRLWRRYLIEGPRFANIVVATWRSNQIAKRLDPASR